MSDVMKVLPLEVLLSWMLKEYESRQSIFGIHESLFFRPTKESPYAVNDMFGHFLATPIGPAAGPHTQLAQNIICTWLSGGRFIELKTVQIMDELEIPRPCIDMEDEGYNVEWSQELRLTQSLHEYIKAWILIHVLRRVLGFEGQVPFGTVFNMSVGYNLEGITSSPMIAFMDRMEDASEEIAEMQTVLQDRFPQFADLEIPCRLTNSVTLSTMHGCPPDEIEQIARYLLSERELHTTVKLNPTLLGREKVLSILHDQLGFEEIEIPDSVFDHDLQYDRAVQLIASLQRVAADRQLSFRVKLSNTLAMANHKRTLPGDEMYMSGRALFPITINLYHKLARDFSDRSAADAGSRLNVSYSAGADALNLTSILATGARPVTMASDLLKPGGYSRMLQCLERLESEMHERGAPSLDELGRDNMRNLEEMAAEALRSPRYRKDYHPFGLPKVKSGLTLFDCVDAPCIEQCAVAQDVPEYAWLIAQGQYDRALKVILSRNPLPGVTGYVCTHLCQTRCTRNNYDQPVAIRALKRFAAERGQVTLPATDMIDKKVAVIGSGPSGLAAAFFLALNGVQVTIFEARSIPGGMLSIAPHFRLPPEVVQADIDRVTALGVKLELNHRVMGHPQKLLTEGFEAVYLATGFQKDALLDIEGLYGQGVFTAIDLLEQVALGQTPELGERVLVIGGGNTAMDCARTAQRLTGRPATIVYRRTRAEMQAEVEEINWLLEEGNCLETLASPTQVILEGGRVAALACVRNRLGEPGDDGRRRPMRIPGSEFQISADSIILAIGQNADLAFLDGSGITFRSDDSIVVDADTGMSVPDVYAGGDVVRGPAIIIQACADGRRAAESICGRLGLPFRPLEARPPVLLAEEIVKVKGVRARKLHTYEPTMLPVDQRDRFSVVEQGYDEETARAEAARCLQCSTFCDKCVEVCPNRANYSYVVKGADWRVPQLACQNERLLIAGEEMFCVTQPRQIIHVDDLCNECGNCATFCVHQGEPFRDKPRLFLQKDDFEQETDNAFYIAGTTVWRRDGGKRSTLSVDSNTIAFENALVRVSLSPDFTILRTELKEPFEGTLSLREAAEMALIFKGVTGSLPFLTD